MEKDEILEKARKENKSRDEYEREVIRDGENIGAYVAAILATVFFIIQLVLGEGVNLGLYAIGFSVLAVEFIVKSIRLKRRHEIVIAILYSVAVVAFSIAHICQLFAASTIL